MIDLCPLMFVLTLREILGVFMTIEKFSELMEKFLSKSEKRPPVFLKWKEKLGRGGFSQILKENFSISSENISISSENDPLPNIYPRVRTNMRGHKSILQDQFHQHFLVTTKMFGRGAFLRFS